MLVVLLWCIALVAYLFVFASEVFVVCLVIDGFVGCLLVAVWLVVGYLVVG